MKVVFVNRYFHPDISATSQILSDLAFHLAASHEVHVVTSRLKYEHPGESLAAQEQIGDVYAHRVWTSRFGRATLPGRALDYFTFYVSATLRLISLVKPGDIVVPMTDPPLISVPASFAARIKGAFVVNWLQDVFPEAAQALGFKSVDGAIGRLLAWLRDRSLLAAKQNVVLGELMGARLHSRGIPAGRVLVIHNWAMGEQVKPLDRAANPLRRDWGLEAKYVIGYSGNMGRAHELAPLLDAAEKLRNRDDVVFLFVGAGNQREALEADARRRGLKNVMFKPYQAREALGVSLTAPDCHVVSLKPALEGLIVPSKLYSSLAAGRPILFLGSSEGEIGTLMRSHESFGMCVDGTEPQEIARAVMQLCDNPAESARMGFNGRRLFENDFDHPIALAKWNALLATVSSGA
jgi:colanic acid biosynthesis glycosyl transferase WcaI